MTAADLFCLACNDMWSEGEVAHNMVYVPQVPPAMDGPEFCSVMARQPPLRPILFLVNFSMNLSWYMYIRYELDNWESHITLSSKKESKFTWI